MPQASRTFRIFVSSTFNDLKEERNALQRDVFPRLRELCTQNGCRFQAIDLRWGVSEEAGLDQQTMKICLDEIERCRRTSPRPNFIMLLGDRYGWRPLPTEIPADEFQEIVPRIRDTAARELLTHWYQRDDNAVPALYCLQPRAGRFVEYTVWEDQVERPLRRAFLQATADLPPEKRFKYVASATEQEIARGALKVEDAPQHVHCFFRRIANLDDLIRDSSANERAKDFVDLDEEGHRDPDARTQLEGVKRVLRQFLPGNVKDYEAQWTGSSLTTQHIPQLCEDVSKVISRIVLREIEQLEEVPPLDKEVADHEAFGRERAKFFIGRSGILQTIGNYAKGESARPLAVVGASGSGKSALIARAAQQVCEQSPDAEVIVRFIGATPGSSDIRALLESLCREISRRYGAEEATVPADYKELVQDFPKRLALASAPNPLILFLDALDQLSDAEHGRNLIWLPAELPEHVGLVVSTLRPGECHTALERKLPQNHRVELAPMPLDEGNELLNLWLTQASRTLQDRQKDEVLNEFAVDGLPLYLKLAFEEARRWRSYTAAIGLSPEIPGIIRDLFKRLSLPGNHGEVMVSRSLGYLAAGKNGLTEDELLDVLSDDEVVLKDFTTRARHEPPENRLPAVVWSRLYFDLEPYLTERSADNTSLMAFYHRQLQEVVEEDYLAGEDKRERHKALANYYAKQALFQQDGKVPNLRKLSELPYQLTYAAQWEDVYKTLTDFDFLEAKCTHVAVTSQGKDETAPKVYAGVYELQEDYRRALEHWGVEPGATRTGPRPKHPLIVTAWLSPSDQSHAAGCPLCRVWSQVPPSALGTELACPKCGSPLKLNPFTINADWRPVAEAWHRAKK